MVLVVILMLMVLTARLASAESLTSRECTDAFEEREDDQLDDELAAIDVDDEDRGTVIEEGVDPRDLDTDRDYPFDEAIDPPDGDADRGYPFDEVIDPPDQGTGRDDAFDVADHPRDEVVGVPDRVDTRDDSFEAVDDVDGERCQDVAKAADLDDHAHDELADERAASVRRSRSWLGRLAGRVDLSLTWRRHLASSGDLHGVQHEVWLVGTWRL